MLSIPLSPPQPARPHHLRRALLLFAIMLAAVLVLGYAVFRALVEREEQQTLNTLNYVANIQGVAVASWVDERTRDAAAFSDGRFLGEAMHEWISRGAPPDQTRERILGQLHAIRNAFGYEEVAVVGPYGEPYLTTSAAGRNSPMLSSAIAYQTVQAALGRNSPQVSTIHAGSGPEPDHRVIDIATPLLDMYERTYKAQTVLLMRADAVNQLEHYVKAMPLVNTATEVVLVEIIGNEVMSTSSSHNAVHFRAFGQVPLTPQELITAARQGQEVTLSSPAGTSIGVVRAVRGTPWFLLAMIDAGAVRANFERLAWLVALTAGGALAVSAFALSLWTRERESRFRLQSFQAATEKALLQRRYDYLSRYANDMIILTDSDGVMQEVNDKTLQLLGRERNSVLGKSIETLFLPECRPVVRAALDSLRERGETRFEVSQRGYLGTLLTFDASARALERDRKVIAQFIFRDISERRASEAALRDSQQRLNSILTSISDVVWSFSADFSRLNYINQSVERVFGRPLEEFIDRPILWLESMYPEDRRRFEGAIAQLSAEDPVADIEVRIVARDGQVRWLHCRGHLVTDEDGKPQRIDGVATDITQKKEAERQVEKLAYYDSVTQLPNRALLHDRLGQALPMAVRSERKVALLFMDLDNFKNINDSLGHEIGDQLLRAIARRILRCVREEDTVARIGGDEFLIVLPDLERASDAVRVAEKILSTAARPFDLAAHRIYTTISIGISVYPDDAGDPQELIRHADSALYQAKGMGRNNYQFFTPELNYQITRTSEIERRLRHAIDNGTLALWYQPQVDARNGKLIGAEALTRWHDGEREYLSPAEFIPVAEERGLISKIGEWALREACMQCRRWQEQGLEPVRVAVNVSPLQFQQKGFVDLVTGILAETGVDGRYLELEITEGALMRGGAEAARLTSKLREHGVGISIDDFGTGYSSLNYLRQIPIDKIKIDRSFISDLGRDGAITRAIVELAHSLQLRVIAEGVESQNQIERLRAFGCDEIQGYYFSRAVSPEAFARLLADRYAFAHGAASTLH